MKILFDHQIFSRQKYGGVSRYFSHLIEALPKHSEVEVALSAQVTSNQYLSKKSTDTPSATHRHVKRRALETLKKSEAVKNTYDRVKKYVNKKSSIKMIRAGEYDIFHPTWVDPYFLSHLNGKPFVVTIHDTIHKIYPHYFSNAEHTVRNMKVLLEHASGIIAISEHTKNDVVRHFSVEPELIHVVHHGCHLDFSREKAVVVQTPFILFVGGRGQYKNFTFFIEAVYKTLLENKICVVCVGGGLFTESERAQFASLGITNLMIQTDATDEELVYLYKHAELFVFPSLYEGFGVPILEAWSGGCPLILSNASCFPEIAGEAGLYFDTGDKDSLKGCVERVLRDKVCREELIRRGSERLTLFSKEECVTKTLAVYQKVLGG